MNSWGILGDPSPEKIQEWQNMPHGEFKTMVATLKKKSKRRITKQYKVEVSKIESSKQSFRCVVYAFNREEAREKAMAIGKSEVEWPEKIKMRDSFTTRILL